MTALHNLLNITDSNELAQIEEKISKEKALALFELGLLNEYKSGSFEALAAIHRQLFGEIYDFAGNIRNVDISKGGFRFAAVIYLHDALKNIAQMPQANFEEIIAKYVEMNVAHPFREGNGRAARIWLDDILKQELGMVVDWSNVDKQDYLLAMERSPIKATEINLLLKEALTEKIHDREVFMKGIDASYQYEDYSVFKTEELTAAAQKE